VENDHVILTSWRTPSSAMWISTAFNKNHFSLKMLHRLQESRCAKCASVNFVSSWSQFLVMIRGEVNSNTQTMHYIARYYYLRDMLISLVKTQSCDQALQTRPRFFKSLNPDLQTQLVMVRSSVILQPPVSNCMILITVHEYWSRWCLYFSLNKIKL